MNNIACYLRCFASENLAFNIFCYLLENIYPNNFFLKTKFGNGLYGLMAISHL